MATVYTSGEITDAPVLKYLPSGTPVLEFRIADTYTDRTGEERTTWLKVAVWEDLALQWAEKLVKGTVVKLKGIPRAEAWIGQDGSAKGIIKVKALSLEVVVGASVTAARQAEAGDTRAECEAQANADAQAAAGGYVADDEDPFGDQ